MGNIFYIETSVLQMETSVSPRFRVILTGIQGAILGVRIPFLKHLNNIPYMGTCPSAVLLLGQRHRQSPNIKHWSNTLIYAS